METPKERRQRYLNFAEKARQMADSTSDREMREHFLKLATGWTALADAVKTVRPKTVTK